MIDELKEAIAKACQDLFGQAIVPELTRPDPQFGDFSTNAALQLAKKLDKNPRDVAIGMADRLKSQDFEAEVAGAGFINIRLADSRLWRALESAVELPQMNTGQEILVEFGDPNPFKEMHIGHAYSYIVGDSISSLLEASGAKVERLSYHGDVGLHVAKAIWGMLQAGVSPESPGDKIRKHIGLYYKNGAQAYEGDKKSEIEQINQQIYDHSNPKVNELYDWGKKTSFSYFDEILKDLDVRPARRFLESESAEKGTLLVKRHEGKVFVKSDGAVVYMGEKAGLHTRVFITSTGLPTYEAKDLGLAELKKAAYPDASQSIIITAHEQAEYFKVMLAALKEFDPATADSTRHIYHGFVSLSSGKMSSRTGEVYSATDLIIDVEKAVEKTFEKASASTRNAAIKYGFLKNRLGSDIIYDVEASVSLEGNSGPYLQYAHARACSILTKAGSNSEKGNDFKGSERDLARKMSEYPEVFGEAVKGYLPHHVCNYLYELAQEFNRFYEANRVIGDEREGTRLELVKIYKDILASGLRLLNIEAPEKI